MTAFLKTFTNHFGIQLGNLNQPLKVEKESDGNVTIHLGGGHLIGGNRPEDFQSLKDAAEKALDIFGQKANP